MLKASWRIIFTATNLAQSINFSDLLGIGYHSAMCYHVLLLLHLQTDPG